MKEVFTKERPSRAAADSHRTMPLSQRQYGSQRSGMPSAAAAGGGVEMVLRGLDATGAVGVVLDSDDRVVCASPEFVAQCCEGVEPALPASLEELNLPRSLLERLAAAVEPVRRARGDTTEAADAEDVVVVEARRRQPRVVVMLAAGSPGREAVPEDRPRQHEVATGPAPRVLLVEDDEMVRSQARRALARDGHLVRSVASAQEALALFESGERFDVMVTDVVMPQMSGPELAEELAMYQTDVAVLFVSGYADGRLVDTEDSEAPRAFLGKPHGPAALREAVASLWNDLQTVRP